MKKRKQPNPDACPSCGHILQVGDYPFCNGTGHETIHSRNASTAPPTIVFRNSKGEYRFPGRDTDKPPRGFQRVELSTQRARDRFEKEYGSKQSSELRDVLYRRQEIWERGLEERKKNLRKIAESSSSEHTKKFIEVCLKDAERRQHAGISQMEAGFHIESNHFSGSNRQPWQDRDTGWKPRK